MYIPARHRAPDEAALHALMREQPFALLVSRSADGPVVNHLPVLLDAEAGLLLAHVARANPVWQQLAHQPAVTVVFRGPAHYVSPAWYASKPVDGRVVPTWNYQAVHAHGQARLVEEATALEALLERLTAAQEQPLHGDGHWRVADAPLAYRRRLLDHILGLEIRIERLEGRWKLSQDHSQANHDSALAGLRGLDHPSATAVAAQMQAHFPSTPS